MTKHSQRLPDSAPDWMQQGWDHIWQPYTQMQTAAPPLPVIGAEGVYLHLEDGRKLIDGISSWWSTCHGHRHPHIIKAIQEQAATLPHVMFAGLAHEQAYKLAARLAAITPAGLERVFFADSGSTSVEVAMKMAVQYWHNQDDWKRQKFICFKHGYHGDTMGCMSLCDPESGMHKSFNNYMPRQFTMDIPHDEYGFSEFEELVDAIHKQAAGVIIEPLAQGAGGMRFHSPDVLAELYRIVKKYDLLFIADEIATGFGRTGMMFACEEAGITPDIMCMGKALTGGTISLAATIATEKVFNAFLSEDPSHAFMHGPTYMANPLACAAANASLDLFESEPRLTQVEHIELQLHDELSPLKQIDNVIDVRVKGAIGVVELAADAYDIIKLRTYFAEHGVWLRPFRNILYIMPSFTISEKELHEITDTVTEALENT